MLGNPDMGFAFIEIFLFSYHMYFLRTGTKGFRAGFHRSKTCFFRSLRDFSGFHAHVPTVEIIRQEKKDDRSQEKSNVVHSNQNQEPDEYDGYYDDVLPTDLNREREGFDMELVKKIGIIAGAVLLIIVLCIVALYLL